MLGQLLPPADVVAQTTTSQRVMEIMIEKNRPSPTLILPPPVSHNIQQLQHDNRPVSPTATNKKWYERPIRGVLLDMHGVLYDSGASKVPGAGPIPGSVDAIRRLREAGIKTKVVSNASTNTRQKLVDRLQQFGYDFTIDDIFTPAPAARHYLLANGLRPHLFVHPNVQGDFDEVPQHEPNCVVMGDAQHHFSWHSINETFQLLMQMQNPILITLGHGKYYKAVDGMKLDVGSYARMLEHALDIKAITMGKPNDSFFSAAINYMNLTKNDVIMIGDDITSDIRGAQNNHIRAVQVKTGKWLPEWEFHESIKPDGITDNLAHAVDLILSNRENRL